MPEVGPGLKRMAKCQCGVLGPCEHVERGLGLGWMWLFGKMNERMVRVELTGS